MQKMMQKRSAKKAMGSGAPKNGTGSVTPKKARMTTKATSKCGAVPEVEEEEEEEIPNVFTHEMDTLQCDICFMPFQSQVYTCKNGHAACAECCVRMNRKCSCCDESIGDFRCRATEKILAGMTRPCKFIKNGCPETVRFTEMRSHEEEECRYAPYRCPFDRCPFRGLHLYGHILDEHAPSASPMGLLRRMKVTLDKEEPFLALLHRDGESVFLLLNGGDVLTGRSLSVVRVCPHPAADDAEEKYTMAVNGDDKPGSMSAVGIVQFVRRLEGFQPKGFLFVPDALWGDAGSVTVDIHF